MASFVKLQISVAFLKLNKLEHFQYEHLISVSKYKSLRPQNNRNRNTFSPSILIYKRATLMHLNTLLSVSQVAIRNNLDCFGNEELSLVTPTLIPAFFRSVNTMEPIKSQ